MREKLQWKHVVVNMEFKFGFLKYGTFLACVNNYYFLKKCLLVGCLVSQSVMTYNQKFGEILHINVTLR